MIGSMSILETSTFLRMENCTSSDHGGGIFINDARVVVGTVLSVKQGRSEKYGGGIHCKRCAIAAEEINVDECTALNGGGMLSSEANTLRLPLEKARIVEP